jgi:hypothetical protein
MRADTGEIHSDDELSPTHSKIKPFGKKCFGVLCGYFLYPHRAVFEKSSFSYPSKPALTLENRIPERAPYSSNFGVLYRFCLSAHKVRDKNDT